MFKPKSCLTSYGGELGSYIGIQGNLGRKGTSRWVKPDGSGLGPVRPGCGPGGPVMGPVDRSQTGNLADFRPVGLRYDAWVRPVCGPV